jgi:hypothetical protein
MTVQEIEAFIYSLIPERYHIQGHRYNSSDPLRAEINTTCPFETLDFIRTALLTLSIPVNQSFDGPHPTVTASIVIYQISGNGAVQIWRKEHDYQRSR